MLSTGKISIHKSHSFCRASGNSIMNIYKIELRVNNWKLNKHTQGKNINIGLLFNDLNTNIRYISIYSSQSSMSFLFGSNKYSMVLRKTNKKANTHWKA